MGTFLYTGQFVPAQAGSLITDILDPNAQPFDYSFTRTNSDGSTFTGTGCGFGYVTCAGSGYDGLVLLDNALDFTTVGGTGMQTIWHEINEVLGIGSRGTQCFDPSNCVGIGIGSTDVYRYSAPGVICYTDEDCYFSIDGGVTSIAGFNSAFSGGQVTNSGSRGDFTGVPCDPQNWVVGLCSGSVTYDTSLASYQMMLAVGYDPVVSVVPVPAALPLFASGLGAMGFCGWRRKRRALA